MNPPAPLIIEFEKALLVEVTLRRPMDFRIVTGALVEERELEVYRVV